MQIQGARFDSSTVFSLHSRADSSVHVMRRWQLVDATQAVARFDLTLAELGSYDLHVEDTSTGASVALHNAVEVGASSGYILDVDVNPGPPVRRGTTVQQTIYIENNGNIDVPFANIKVANNHAPHVLFRLEGDSTTPDYSDGGRQELEVMGIGLRPGERHPLSIQVQVSSQGPRIGHFPIIAYAVPLQPDSVKYGPYRAAVLGAREHLLNSPDLADSLRQVLADSTAFWSIASRVFDDQFLDPTPTNADQDNAGLTAHNPPGHRPDAPIPRPPLPTFQDNCTSMCGLATAAGVAVGSLLGGLGAAALGGIVEIVCSNCCTPAYQCTMFCPKYLLRDCICRPEDQDCGPCQRNPLECTDRPPDTNPDVLCRHRIGRFGEDVEIIDRPDRSECARDGLPSWCFYVRRRIRTQLGFLTPNCIGWECRRWCREEIAPIDPNEKMGPSGFGAEGWVGVRDSLNYQVFFENLAEASGPASEVVLRDELDANLNAGSFRLGTITIGDLELVIPFGQAFFETRLDMTAQRGVLVDVTAGIDVSQAPPEAFWRFQSIDPSTGRPPTDGSVGFLPPNDSLGVGEGRVTYSIRPRGTAATGASIANTATIVFDLESPIATNVVSNKLDSQPPVSRVEPLPGVVTTSEVVVTLAGQDLGSGIGSYDLYSSVDGGPFALYQRVADSQVLFIGEPGRQYGFFSIATDNVGNVEASKDSAEATVVLGSNLSVWPGVPEQTRRRGESE